MMTDYREDFPILSREVHDRPLVYLDNAATTQKPRAVLEAMDALYTTCNAQMRGSFLDPVTKFLPSKKRS